MKNFEGLAVTLDKIDSYADYEIRSIRITLVKLQRVVEIWHRIYLFIYLFISRETTFDM